MADIEARIERIVGELERLWVRLGMVLAIQSLIDAGVDVTRGLEELDKDQPHDNETYQRKYSVKMESVRSIYQQEERDTRSAAAAARQLLITRIREQVKDGE